MKNILFLFTFLYCSALFGQNWKPIGPVNRTGGNGQGAGMVKSIAFHPSYNLPDPALGGSVNKTVFIGSPFGGIWISRDDGLNWANADPLGQYVNLSTDLLRGCGVMDIIIDYNNPLILYAAMRASEYAEGFKFGTTSVLMKNYHPSTGIYKYTPSTGWTSLLSFPYQSNNAVFSLTLDPINPTIFYASTSNGILKFTNSGNNVSNILSNGNEFPFRNVVFDPINSAILFASGQNVYKSTNAGSTWTQISNFSTLLPTGAVIIISNIAVLSSSSIYARVFYNIGASSSEAFLHFNGTNWTMLNMFGYLWAYTYDRFPIIATKVGAIEYVYAGSEQVNLFNSSTSTWSNISSYNGDMHADIHDIAFSSDLSTLWVAHDGGISSTYSNFYSNPIWNTINAGLNISTIFSFAGAQKSPDLFLVGELDNGNSYVNNADENNYSSINWIGYGIADGGDKMISWDNPNDWYDKRTMYSGGVIYRNTTGNPYASGVTQVFTKTTIDPLPGNQWDPHEFRDVWGEKNPLVMDPNNSNVIYRGANVLLRSDNYGSSSKVIFRKSDCFDTGNFDFYGTVNAVAVAPSNSNYLYLTYNNIHLWDPLFTNHVYKTTNALSSVYKGPCPHSLNEGIICADWQDITPPFPTLPSSILKISKINSVVVSDKDPNLIWVGFSYNPNLTNFLVWKYDGISWVDWGQGLPSNMSITYLCYEKGSEDGIYAGTDNGGVYFRNKSMNNWVLHGTGMPHALIEQMEINNTDNSIRAGTKGRGIMKCDLYCPSANLLKNNCFNCNSLNDYFWEGNLVSISNSTMNVDRLEVRAVEYISIVPGGPTSYSLFESSSNPNNYYKFFIHGCDESHPNTY